MIDKHLASLWYKTPEQRKQAESVIGEVFAEESQQGYIFGPIRFYDADLSARNTPEPPDAETKLLVGEADLLAIVPTRGEKFVLDLDSKDLALLRKLTQEAWLKYPDNKPMPADELDRVISLTAPDVIDKMLRYGHEQSRLH